jgi:hypothetical protein
MSGNILRKIIIALIIIAPVLTYTDCRKQPKCGCGKDEVATLTNASAYIYWSDGATIQFQTISDVYSTYFFCNPSEMLPKLADSKSGDVLLVSGHVYYNCQ